jgi:predicted Zn finger-like uncharacterized protein
MIIQCEKCQTRFRLDDSRVTEKGVKVRCTKCKHVFTVRREESGEETLPPEVTLVDFSPPAEESATPAAPDQEWSFAAEVDPAPAADTLAFGDIPLDSEPGGFTPLESSPFDTSDISFDTEEHEMTSSVSDQAAQAGTATLGSEFDFSDDELSGSVVQTTPETAPDSFSFDFEGASFLDSMSGQNQNSEDKGDRPSTSVAPVVAPFSLGEIDFGEDLTSVAVAQVNQDDLKPSQNILSEPLAAAAVTSDDLKLTQSFLDDAASSEQQEPPPLSIASRRKQSPVFGALIAGVALLVVAVLGFFGYSSFSTPKEDAPQESGRIGLLSVKGAFVNNTAAGELLVVSGEALNEYAKPRAALQVTVTVLDAAGQKVAAKNAYGGNPLTKEQLETLPLDKIEAAMANPFGDSLANMGVAPGKSIPFVVVLAGIPAGAKDLTVKSAGSTVATGK